MAEPAFDRACIEGFLDDYERAAAGQLDDWVDTPRSSLALILLLDQFARNMFRRTARAFATDSMALASAKQALAREFDLALTPVERAFFYLPFEHSENLDDQREAVRLFRRRAGEDAATDGYVKYAEQHMEVIRRFGRFPHRNAILGRVSTLEEKELVESRSVST